MLGHLISSFRTQPRALFRLCTVEVWERFGFVTTVALTALYFASPIASGGLGWTNADALLWLGYYAAFLFTLPILGGWVADHWIGHRSAIQIGGVMMAVGYFGLGCVPYLLYLTGLEPAGLKAVFSDAGLAMAHPVPGDEAWARMYAGVADTFDEGESSPMAAIRAAYLAQTVLLAFSFLLIAAGNALFKPSVSATVGALYEPGDARRDGGFTLFWTFINAGSFLAYIVGGAVGERLGWNIGYFVAFAGMCAGLIYFWRIRHTLPVSVPGRQAHLTPDPPRKLTRQETLRIVAALILTAFAIVFNASHAQILGLINLFVQQDVDKTIGGFDVPTLWVTAINPIVILCLAPIVAVIWDRLGKVGRNPSFVMKFVIALTALAIGEFILFIAAGQAEGPEQAAIMLVIFAIMAMSFAEIPLQPIGLSMMSALSPRRFVGLLIGVWLFGMAIASGIAGNVGALASVYGLQAIFFWSGASCLLAAALLFALRRPLLGWMSLDDAPEPIEPTAQVLGEL